MLDSSTVQLVSQLLDEAVNVLVIAHIAPDGDAIGSLLAVGVALKQMRKQCALVCDDGLPKRFGFLPLAESVIKKPERSVGYDLLISVDCGDTERMGRAYSELRQQIPPIVNIDHHITNTKFGLVNLVDPKANSTTEILFKLLPQLGAELTPDLSTCLLSGLVTDTLGFRTANVNAGTLRIASELLDSGIDLFSIITKALDLKELSTLQIWQKGLKNVRLEDGVIWTTISNAERLETEHNGTSSFGLGNMMANVYQAKMSAVILELEDGRISVGFRSRPPFSVSELAEELGGGGHHQASGCTIDGPLQQAEALIISRSKENVRRQQALLESE